MPSKKKPVTKKKASKYEDKVSINGSFADVIKVSTNYTPPKKAKPEKKKK